jgi:hypothetical protein
MARRGSMRFVTTYRVKPHLTREDTKKLMETFAKNGEGPGTTAHYVAADGSHGVVISEIDDAAVAYKSILPYTEWIDYQTVPVLTIEEAVPHILENLA